MAMQAQLNSGKETAAVHPPFLRAEHGSFYDLHRAICLKGLALPRHSRFASHLALHFPLAAMRIDEEDFGTLHLEVGALKLETLDAIRNRNWDVIRKHFAFVSEIMEDAESELRKAIEISYLGSLFYGETSLNFAKARSLLPPNLAAALNGIEEHYEFLVF